MKMTLGRALKIAQNIVKEAVGTVYYFPIVENANLHVQVVEEQGYYDNTPYVCYIDIEDDNGDTIESHTSTIMDIEQIAHWINYAYKTYEDIAKQGKRIFVIMVDGCRWYEIMARSFEMAYRSEKAWFDLGKTIAIRDKETNETKYYEVERG